MLRHSCAVALFQSGTDVTVIRDYLGHASVATTGRYITTNLQMKRDALERSGSMPGSSPLAPSHGSRSPACSRSSSRSD